MRLSHSFKNKTPLYLIIGIILVAAPVHGQTKNLNQTIQVIGRSTTSGQDPTAARKQAIADGLRLAVGLAALEIVPSDLFADRFEAMTIWIDQKGETFVRNYKVLAEKQNDDGYRVLIEAVVVGAQLKAAIDQAGLLKQKRTQPTLLFLIAEQHVGDSAPRFWWHEDNFGDILVAESALAREMVAKGYSIADHSTPVGKIESTMDVNAATAADIGRRYHADVVITGQAVAGTAKDTRVTDLKTYKGTLTVRAYQTGAGAQIGISHASTVSVNKDDDTGGKSVFASLAREVAEDLDRQLTFHQQHPDEASPTPFTIDVSGTDHLRGFVALRRALNTMPNVEQMQIKALTPPTALLIVHFRGSLPQMVDHLKKIKTAGLNIQIKEMAVDRLKVILSP